MPFRFEKNHSKKERPTGTKVPKVTSVLNAILPTPAQLLGEGTGMVDLSVRFLLIEQPDGSLVLVDGGFGPDIRKARGLKAWLYRLVMHIPRKVVTPAEALAAMGRSARDIRHVVLTHLHADHVCNLDIVPDTAELHVSRDVAAMLRAWHDHGKRPPVRSANFPELVPAPLARRARIIEEATTRRLADASGGSLVGHDILGDGSILAADLPGHATGQVALALPYARYDETEAPLVYGVDAAWTYEGLMGSPTPAERIGSSDAMAARESRAALTSMIRAGYFVLLCHDDRTQQGDRTFAEARP